MAEDLVHAKEYLGAAVWRLATGTGAIKDRLINAFSGSDNDPRGPLAVFRSDSLPPDLKVRWGNLKECLTPKPGMLPGLTPTATALHNKHGKTVARYANEILDLYLEVVARI